MPAAPYDTAPAERWQHGAEPEMTPPGRQSVIRPVVELLRRRRVTEAEVCAADRYYTDYAFSVGGAQDATRAGAGGGADGFTAAQIDALTRYRRAREALGPSVHLVDLIVLREMSVRAIAGPGSRPRARVAEWVAEALRKLAEHYAIADQVRPNAWAPTRAISVSR